MGADLYINPLYEENYKKYEPEFRKWVNIRDEAKDKAANDAAQKQVSIYYEKLHAVGYFRDSYNGTNCLNALGLSWWQDVSKLQNKQGIISVRNVKKLLALIEPLPVQSVDAAWLKKNHCQVDETETVESWNKYFADGKAELVAFLKKAIELNLPIEASL